DINIYSKNFEEHLTHLEEVFYRLNSAGLRLKPTKYHFMKQKLKFLDH
ncbi:5375_t:CDS:1, partial [Racocetra persica]